MVRFGPSGNSDSFYGQGHKSSLEMPEWLRNMGLTAYEYSFGRGIRIGREMAAALRGKAAENGISVSVHAPYYINLASEDPEAVKKSEAYIFESARLGEAMGAERMVLHPGSLGGLERKKAFSNIKGNLCHISEKLKAAGHSIILCPETLGKKNQVGSLEEILELCAADASLIPTFDFGHLHAVSGGGLKTRSAYRSVFDRLFEALGEERGRTLHIHYSRVEFTEKGGERRHWRYDDREYGPEFEPLAECLIEYGVSATVICESRGTMAEDAVKVKNIYTGIRDGYLFNLENI